MCPGDFAGVFALEEEGSGFGAGEAEDFGVTPDKELALAGVDSVVECEWKKEGRFAKTVTT